MVRDNTITNTPRASKITMTSGYYVPMRHAIRKTESLSSDGFAWGISPSRRIYPFGTADSSSMESLNAHRNNDREYDGGSRFYASSERTRNRKIAALKRSFNNKRS